MGATTSRDWRHESVCRDEDPELFFATGESGPALLQIEQAKAVCGRCPVAGQCLKWALDSGQDFGVWGGLSEKERRAMKRRADQPAPKALTAKTAARRPADHGDEIMRRYDAGQGWAEIAAALALSRYAVTGYGQRQLAARKARQMAQTRYPEKAA